MAILCPEHRLLFIMVPGTGCSAIGQQLVRHLGGRYLPEQDVVREGRVVVPRKHNTVEQLLSHGLLTQGERANLTVVATVRNPFDRMVTYYQRLVGDWKDYYLGVRERRIERESAAMTQEMLAKQRRSLDRAQERLDRRQRLLRHAGFDAWAAVTGVRWHLKHRRGAWSRSPSLQPVLFPMLDGVDVVMRYERLGEAYEMMLKQLGVETPEPLPHRNPTPGKKPYTSYYAAPTRALLQRLFTRDLRRFGYRFEGPDDDRLLIRLDDGVPAAAPPPTAQHA